jgi:PAS domain S-box-containing protein
MEKKLTYEELEQRVKELEKYAIECKRTEEILRDETYLSQILLDSIPSVALLIKPKTREIVHSNKHAAKVGAISGKQCFVTWGKSSVPCPWCLAPKLWDTGETQRIEVVVSDTVWDTYWVPITEDLYLHYAFDITERKKSEKELLKQKYFLSKAQEIGKIGTWELDIKKNILVWTDENYRIFGLPIGTELTYETFLDCVHPADRKYVDKEWKAAFNKKPYDIEHRLLMSDGSIKWVREKAQLEFDEQGNCLRGVGFTQDITKRKQAEESLKARQQEIEKLNATLERRVHEEVEKSRQKDLIMMHQSRLAVMGEMIGLIAHQWRQPLNALNFLLYNIQDCFEDADSKEEILDDLIKNGVELIKKMSTTIDDFRRFFTPHKEKVLFSVNNIIKDTLSLLKPSLKYNNISVMVNEERDVKVAGFPNEYSQVILNILNNAKDAIVAREVRGEITIDISKENDSAIVSIKDNGGGITKNIINKIFDSYFTTKKGGEGTGIGLYVSKVIIEEHMNGHINVKNISGGTEFVITLPATQS